MTQLAKESTNQMATKLGLITDANRGIRPEVANAALLDFNPFEPTGRKPEAVSRYLSVMAVLLPIIAAVFLAFLVITERDVAEAVRERTAEIALPADSFARAVAFAISQPEDVDVNEILFRPTRQQL
jgi:hypothetical protein